MKLKKTKRKRKTVKKTPKIWKKPDDTERNGKKQKETVLSVLFILSVLSVLFALSLLSVCDVG